jgi:hypothetical protein
MRNDKEHVTMRLHLGLDDLVSGQLARLLQGVERRLASPSHSMMLAQTDTSSTVGASACVAGEDCGRAIGTHPHPGVELFVVAAVALIVGFVLGRLFPSKNLVKVDKNQ